VLARCKNPADAPAIVQRLEKTYNTGSDNKEKMSAFTSTQFSLRSRIHWLTKTKGGIALGYAAMLGLLVGGVVTSQTLYAATAASLREYAVLRALGIPRWRMGMMVLAQSFWVGIAGVALALPSAWALAQGAEALGARVMLPPWLLVLAVCVTMTMAMVSGLAALRSLRLIEPAILLR
jgi:putative ABC transport system permease protein